MKNSLRKSWTVIISLSIFLMVVVPGVYAIDLSIREVEITKGITFGHDVHIGISSTEAINDTVKIRIEFPEIEYESEGHVSCEGDFRGIKQIYISTTGFTFPVDSNGGCLNWKAYDSGTYNITIILDPNNLINESNETNNKANASLYLRGGPLNKIEVTGGPDLAILGVGVGPTYVNHTYNTSITLSVKNRGNQEVKSMEYAVRIPELDYEYFFVEPSWFKKLVELFFRFRGEDETWSAMQPGDVFLEGVLKKYRPHFIDAGNYTIIVEVDPKDRIKEVNESNNIYTQIIEIK